MIDIHTHILPGVDDGSPNMEASLQMAAMAAGTGTHCLVMTPHSNQEGRFENFFDESLRARFRELKNAAEEAEIPLTLCPGMEIFASDDIGEKIRDGRLIGLNQSHYYLVEFYFDESSARITRCLDAIFEAGGIPLLAHPERYFCVQDHPALLYGWIQRGCLSQINKGSLFGRFGRDAMHTAEELLFNGLVTCIGSDAHSPYRRTTHMRDTEDWLLAHLGRGITYLLTEENPRNILEDLPVAPHGRPPGDDSFYF